MKCDKIEKKDLQIITFLWKWYREILKNTCSYVEKIKEKARIGSKNLKCKKYVNKFKLDKKDKISYCIEKLDLLERI